MPGSDENGDVIVLDSSDNEDADNENGQEVLFVETFGIDKKKKARHTRFASETSSGNEGRNSRSPAGCAANVEEDDDFVIDTASAASKFGEDDTVLLDTNSAERTDEEWPDAPNGDSISLNCVLTTDSSLAPVNQDNRPKRRAIECFNCGGPHIIGKCPEPRDQARIARAMRQQRMNRTPDVGRYHEGGDDDLASRFRAGVISPELADALGLRRNELPEWIYRMRKLGFIKGYPPGYLKQAIVSERQGGGDILQFHFDQPTDGESRETDEPTRSSSVDANKVIYYFGFNKAAREGTRDREGSWYTVPSFETFVNFHQEELHRQHEMAQRAHRPKRHHQGDEQTESSPSKKLKKEAAAVVDMDVSSDEEPGTSGDLLLPPPPVPPTEYDSLTEEELEQLLERKRREMADMEEIGSPEPEESEETEKAVTETPVVIPMDEGGRAITPPTVERRLIRHASSRSLDVMVGTPLGAPHTPHFLKPSLDNFSKGIVPFTVQEEAPDAHKGFFNRIMAKLKGIAGGKLKPPKAHNNSDASAALRGDKRRANRQRKQKK